MTISNAVFLGLLQALGEFLPISSSAHLALFPFFSGEAYQGLTYDVALHLATLIAVVCYFWKDLLKLIKSGLTAPKTQEGRLFWYIGLATVPAAIFGYFFQNAAEHAFRSPVMIAVMLIIFAGFLMFADSFSAKIKQHRRVFTLGTVMLIGCAQALAIMPGVSRSGATITAALLLGFSRERSAKISFFLAMPIIAGAAVLKLKDVALSEINAAFIAGFLAALTGGWLVIKFLMKYLQTHTFDLFVYYRWVLGAVIIGLCVWRG
jgi:undecaprenyl-diphosphatase